MFQNLCRLCSNKHDLLWVFDEKMADDMSNIITVTTGVEISKTDMVSQMVCSTCCQVTIKMYQFRTKSIKNDKDLKARCAGYKVVQMTNATTTTSKSPVTLASPVTPATLTTSATPTTPTTPVTPANQPVSAVPKIRQNVHFSIKEIMVKYPKIVLPRECWNSHLGAYITLLTDEIDDYVKEHNLTDEQIGRVNMNTGAKRRPQKRANLNEIRTLTEIKIARVEGGDEKRRKTRLNSDSSSGSEILKQALRKGSDSKRVERTTRRLNLEALKRNDKSNELRPEVSDVKGNKDTQTEQKNNVISVGSKGSKEAEKPAERGTSELNPEVSTSHDNEKEGINSEPSNSSNTQLDTGIDESLTLRALLNSSANPLERTDTSVSAPIEIIDETPAPPVGTSSEPTTAVFGWFTSRPFLNNQSRLSFQDDDVIFIDNDVVLVENEKPPEENNQSNSATSGSETNVNKCSFVEALELAPKDSECDNTPDLSLVSLATKSYTLYTCRVCDSQHSSLKDLKTHERKNHTKCPFCNKRFRTLVSREEHLIKWCLMAPIKMKDARLVLTKVDEDESVRKKYPNAFGFDVDEREKAPTDTTEVPAETTEALTKPTEAPTETTNALTGTTNAPTDTAKAQTETDKKTQDTLNEIEKFLDCPESFPPSPPTEAPSCSNTNSLEDEDVICISDEESEIGQTQKSQNDSGTRKINVINTDILNNVSMLDDDMKVLKKILSKSHSLRNEQVKDVSWHLSECPIVDGSNNRVKIFKNLRKYLHRYKIPIEVNYGADVSVKYKPYTGFTPRRSVLKTWSHMAPTQLKPYQYDNGSPLVVPPKKPICSIVKVQSAVKDTTTTKTVETATLRALAPTSNVKTMNFILAPMSTNTVTSTSSSSPIILNHNHQKLTNMYRNFVLVPGTITSISQSLIPGVQTVTSTTNTTASDQPSLRTVAQLASITNSLMPASTSNLVVTTLNPTTVHDESNTVQSDQITTVQNNQVKTVENDKTKTVQNNPVKEVQSDVVTEVPNDAVKDVQESVVPTKQNDEGNKTAQKDAIKTSQCNGLTIGDENLVNGIQNGAAKDSLPLPVIRVKNLKDLS